MNPWHIAVLIPARDEEDLLPRCLKSVAEARKLLPWWVTSDVIVVSDRSSDRTLQIAMSMLGEQGVALNVNFGCVGTSRQEAAKLALERSFRPVRWCWLANTDADCEVPTRWLVDQLHHAEAGAAAIAGIVSVDTFWEHQPHVAMLFRETYSIHSDGTHPHVHGANMGVRADAYLEVGGWAMLETAEDHDLWNRIGLSGHKRISNASLRVVTSGRRKGRAPSGFASALAAHNGAGL
jgi:glycosyltransferase involved in cell wall biosynthesis